MLNCVTYRTEGSKSALLTACRGLGIDISIAQSLSDMIPFERDSNWSLSDCFNGNEESERQPVTELIKAVDNYPNLKETAFRIEGLISGRGIHASAVYCYDNGYLLQNSIITAPNGTLTTAFNMADSDYMGGLKVDFLTTKNLDKMHRCVDMLIADGYMQDKGSVKATYDHYLHPDVIDYNSPDMWKMLDDGKLIDAFQFDSPMGAEAIKTIQPKSVLELANGNTLMRLMAVEGEGLPMEIYAKHKADINIWYDEMREHGLSDAEIEIMKEHLLQIYGVAESQESMMLLVMDKRIAGFSVKEANLLRKAVAKKKKALLEEVKELYFDKAKANGTSENLTKYVWDVQIKRQLGYSFSLNHTMPYSVICLQEMNLAYYFPKVYWNTACLTVNAGADEDNDNNKSTNYGKIAKALSVIQVEGQKILPPYINKARFSYSPDAENNAIVFGFKGVSGIGDDYAAAIVANQPFKSFEDFTDRMGKSSNVIALIKAGAFDELDKRDRQKLMYDYIASTLTLKTKLSDRELLALKEYGLYPIEDEGYAQIFKLYRFKQAVLTKENVVIQNGKTASTWFYRLKENMNAYFLRVFGDKLRAEQDYTYIDTDVIAVKRGSLEKVYKTLSKSLEKVYSDPETVRAYNHIKVTEEYNAKVQGSISSWEFDSLCYYYHEHELKNIDRSQYYISNFFDLPEKPEIADSNSKFTRYSLARICGTVLDRNKNKHIVTLLTPEGVVEVKFYKAAFLEYDKQIKNEYATEQSWFKRGNKLIVTGLRRGDKFIAKVYSNSVFKNMVQLITNINEHGKIKTLKERADNI